MELPDPDVGVEGRPRPRSGLHDRHEAERAHPIDSFGEYHSYLSCVRSVLGALLVPDRTDHSRAPLGAARTLTLRCALCRSSPVLSVPQRAAAQPPSPSKMARNSRAHRRTPIAMERAPPQTTHTRPRHRSLHTSPLRWLLGLHPGAKELSSSYKAFGCHPGRGWVVCFLVSYSEFGLGFPR